MKAPHVTLEEVRAALRKGGVAEGEILNDENHVSGICREDGTIVLNPAPGVVEVLLHELIHRLHWRWGEKRVQAEAGRLLSRMTDHDVRAFYRAYRKRAKKLPSPVTLKPEQIA